MVLAHAADTDDTYPETWSSGLHGQETYTAVRVSSNHDESEIRRRPALLGELREKGDVIVTTP
jgi:hypothetical protein